LPKRTAPSLGGLARLSYLGRQVELVDDVDLEKHLQHDLTSVEVVEVGVDEVEVEQSIVVRRLQLRRLTVGQLSLLPSAGREMSTSQSAVMLCGWGLKAGMVHSTCG